MIALLLSLGVVGLVALGCLVCIQMTAWSDPAGEQPDRQAHVMTAALGLHLIGMGLGLWQAWTGSWLWALSLPVVAIVASILAIGIGLSRHRPRL